MKNVLQLAVTALLALCASTAWAQLPVTTNSCTATVDSPFQGANSASDPSADGVLWPPNHKFSRPVVISAENSSGDACNVTINDVRQDEMVSGPGSGNTSPDAQNCNNAGNDSSVELRGERSGMGDGRYYHIQYTMDDPKAPGQPKMGDAKILVPHDQGIVHVGTYVDGGPVFASGATDPITCSTTN